MREWFVTRPQPGCTPPSPDMTSWRVRRQKDEEHRIRKEEKEATKRIRKEKERQARERDARAVPGGPYGAYTNPMNDLDRRMDNVDLNRARGPSVGEYNSKRKATYAPRPAFLISLVNPQGRPISTRSHRHRPTWVLRIWGIRPKLPQQDTRTLRMRRPGMGPT